MPTPWPRPSLSQLTRRVCEIAARCISLSEVFNSNERADVPKLAVSPSGKWCIRKVHGVRIRDECPLDLRHKERDTFNVLSVCRPVSAGRLSSDQGRSHENGCGFCFLVHGVFLISQLAVGDWSNQVLAYDLPNCCSQPLDESRGQLIGVKADFAYESLNIRRQF